MADDQTAAPAPVDPTAPGVDPSLPAGASQPTEAPTAAAPVGADPTSPLTSPETSAATTGDPAQLASDNKKADLATTAEVLGADVPSGATKADIAEAIVSTTQTSASAPAAAVTVDNPTSVLADTDALSGSWVDVVSGEYQGRFGAYVAPVDRDATTGVPSRVIVRTRDADNLLIEVEYKDVAPSERTGGR